MKVTLFVLSSVMLSIISLIFMIILADYLSRPLKVKRFEGLDYEGKDIYIITEATKSDKTWCIVWIAIAIILGRISYKFLLASNQLPW